MFNKILTHKGFFFAYCAGVYALLVLLAASLMSPVLLNAIAESLAGVLLAYWVAKMIVKYIAVRSRLTPLVFFIIQLVALFTATAVTHHNTGSDYVMWCSGIALALFLVAHTVQKKRFNAQQPAVSQ